MLSFAKFDPLLKYKLITGVKSGFDIGFRGSPNNCLQVQNHKSTDANPDLVSDHIQKELALGRLSGPFANPPFTQFQINPIGLIPKKGNNSFRMILDLSCPNHFSINSGIHDIFAKVSYQSVDDAIKLILACGPAPFLAKCDVKSAFRLLPIRPDLYHLLGFHWQGSYYFDKCLPMGARSSCQLFETLSSAIQFLAEKSGIRHMAHYLDDFLFVHPKKLGCNDDLAAFMSICKVIGVPLAGDKTKGPATTLEFLGLELDTVAETVSLPRDKLDKCVQAISTMLGKKRCTLHELQCLLGLLNFACLVVVPGRAFLKRLQNLTCGISKAFFSIRLTAKAKEDLKVWLLFLQHFNGVIFYRDELFLSPTTKHIFSDAAKTTGYGAFFKDHWFSCPWPSAWWTEQNITLLELIPLVVALEAWSSELKNVSLVFHTDNAAIVYVVNSQSSKEDFIMPFIHRLVVQALLANIRIRAVHVPGLLNAKADALSRLQVAKFLDLHPTADRQATVVPTLPASLSSTNRQ